MGHIVDSSEKKRVLLRGLRKEFAVTAEVIRATELDFEDAVSRLVTSEAEREDSDSDHNRKVSSSALSTTQGHMKCKFYGKRGHAEDQCFFNSESPNYRPQLAKKRIDRRRNRGYKGYRRQNVRKRTDRDGAFGAEPSLAYVDVSFFSSSGRDADKSHHMTALTELRIKRKWYIDSGASSHMCNDRSLFNCFCSNVTGLAVSVGDGKQAEVTGFGSVYCTSIVHGKAMRIELKNVLCVPELICNLISVGRIADAGFSAVFTSPKQGKSTCEVKTTNTNTVLMIGIDAQRQGLYEAIVSPFRNETEKARIATGSLPKM